MLQAEFDQNLSGRDNAIFGEMLIGYSRREAEACLDEIQSQQTVALVSHSHHHIARLCDRAILITKSV